MIQTESVRLSMLSHLQLRMRLVHLQGTPEAQFNQEVEKLSNLSKRELVDRVMAAMSPRR